MGHLIFDKGEVVFEYNPVTPSLPEEFLEKVEVEHYFADRKERLRYEKQYAIKKRITEDMMNPYITFWDRVKLAWRFITLKH